MAVSEERVTAVMPSSSEKRVTVEDEDPQKLIASRRKKIIRTNRIVVGVILSVIVVSLLCSFLIPGLPKYHKNNLWQFAAMLFIGTTIIIVTRLEEFGLSCTQTEEPKPLTGFELY